MGCPALLPTEASGVCLAHLVLFALRRAFQISTVLVFRIEAKDMGERFESLIDESAALVIRTEAGARLRVASFLRLGRCSSA